MGPPYKLLHMLRNLYNAKILHQSETIATMQNLEEVQRNFEDHLDKMRQDLLKWVDDYMQEFRVSETKAIKDGIVKSSDQTDKLSAEILNIKHLVTNTEQALEMNNTLDAPLLKRIKNLIDKSDIKDLEFEKYATLLYEQELNKFTEVRNVLISLSSLLPATL